MALVNVCQQVLGDEQSGGGSSTSFFNLPEALVVAQTVERLVNSGVDPQQIGVMTPYSAQVSLVCVSRLIRVTQELCHTLHKSNVCVSRLETHKSYSCVSRHNSCVPPDAHTS
jgi:hypothetical protein